jgi:hypothetical protein
MARSRFSNNDEAVEVLVAQTFEWRRNLARMPTTREVYGHYIQVWRKEVDAVSTTT